MLIYLRLVSQTLLLLEGEIAKTKNALWILKPALRNHLYLKTGSLN